MIVKLVLKSLQHEKVRFATAVLGVAAATGLVVWSLGLAVTSAAQSRVKVRRMTAPYACWVSTGKVGVRMDRASAGAMMRPSREQMMACIPSNVVVAVQSLPEVEGTLACKTVRATLDFRPGGRVMQGPPLMAVLTQASTSGCPYAEARVSGTWPKPDDEEPVAAVCSAVFTPRKLAPPPLGSSLVLLMPSGTVTVKIGAIIDFPQTINGFPTMFVSAGVLRQAIGGVMDPQPNLLLCRLRRDADAAKLATAVDAQAGAVPLCTVVGRRDVESQFASDKLQNFKRQAPLLLMLSVLTALCMLVNALTVGVEQKLRMLALLRAVGMTTRQVAHTIMLEGVIVACSGWLLGLFGGWLILALFVQRSVDAFPEGVALGWITPVCTAVGVAVIAALSLYWPCRRAMRIRPLDVLAEDRAEQKPISIPRTLLGFFLLFPMLLLALPLHISPMTRSVLLLAAGIPLHLIGLVLCLPFYIRGMERLSGPTVSAMLGLDPRLLHRRISRHYARTAGMVITLAVGLGSFSAIHIWGGSMMAPFLPSPEFPDAIVSILPNGVPRDAAQQVAKLEGVDRGQCLPIEVAQFFLTDDLTARVVRVSGKAPMSPNVLLFGTAPQETFGGDRPLAPFRFVAGERRQAADALEKGGACIVTRMFNRESGLGVGDNLTIVKRPPAPPEGRGGRGGRPGGFGGGGPGAGSRPSAGPEMWSGSRPADGGTGGRPGRTDASVAGPVQTETFKIVGVVDLNWHMITSRAQLRGRNNMPGGTMGPAFVSEADARRLSGNENTTSFLWVNLSEAYRKKGPLPGGQQLETDIRNALQIDDANTVRVHHRDEIEDGTIAHGAQLIGDMARAPFWSLIVLATGIITLLIASFQSAAKEIAVMRAIGMTRSQLGRMLLGEAVLTGLCGIALSLISGFCIGWTFTGWTRAWMSFGGLPVSLSIPWLVILQGVGFALVLCIVMAVLPIVWLVRKQDESGGLTVQ